MLRKRPVLSPTNDSANIIYKLLLEKLPTKYMSNESMDSVVKHEDSVQYSVEFLNMFDIPDISPQVLYLKV